MHGDEHAGVTLAISIIHATRSVETINLWVIPTMNPDGDAAHTRQNAHGVDLNRNWPDKWVHLDPPYYSGTKPLSEPESLAMWRFFWASEPDYLVVLHQPLYGVDTTDGSYLDPHFRDALARNLDLPKKAFLCGGVCHGSMTGWFTSAQVRRRRDDRVRLGPDDVLPHRSGAGRDHLRDGRALGPARRARPAALRHDDGRGPRRWTSYGWTFDPDSSATSTASSTSCATASGRRHAAVTGQPSPIVNATYHITGTHRFEFIAVRLARARTTVCLVYHEPAGGDGIPAGVPERSLRVRRAA